MALQESGNGLDRVTTLELDGKWMLGQLDARLSLISLQGGLEKRLKTCGS